MPCSIPHGCSTTHACSRQTHPLNDYGKIMHLINPNCGYKEECLMFNVRPPALVGLVHKQSQCGVMPGEECFIRIPRASLCLIAGLQKRHVCKGEHTSETHTHMDALEYTHGHTHTWINTWTHTHTQTHTHTHMHTHTRTHTPFLWFLCLRCLQAESH